MENSLIEADGGKHKKVWRRRDLQLNRGFLKHRPTCARALKAACNKL